MDKNRPRFGKRAQAAQLPGYQAAQLPEYLALAAPEQSAGSELEKKRHVAPLVVLFSNQD